MSAGLNLAQLEAVNHLGGPCLVLAGAGSGKTRVITHKIGRLIQAGLAADRIAAITFTNKAAAEMRERAGQLVGRDAKKVLICTFHALGVRLLREDGAALGLKQRGFRVIANDHNAYAHTLATAYVQADRDRWLAPAETILAELRTLKPEAGWFTKAFCEDARYFHPDNGAVVDAMRFISPAWGTTFMLWIKTARKQPGLRMCNSR